MSIELPVALRAFASRGPEWADWLDRLPRLVAGLLTEWALSLDGTARNGETALVLPVRTATGETAALKVGMPHPEAALEHLALRAWDGGGAVRLLRADPHRWALLLERADAERDLNALDVIEACEVVAGLYPRLHRPALPQLTRLSSLAEGWAEELTGLRGTTLAPRRFVDQAAGLAAAFASDPGSDRVLVHGDLHYANVLASQREAWLVIDPKPLAGDPAFEVAPLLWNRWDEAVATRDLRGAVLERLYTVVDVAGFDEDRVRDWVVVREMVNVLWASRDARSDQEWITRCTTIVKAVQR